jgi:ribonuclease P protein component
MKFSSSLKLNHIFRRLYHSNGQAGPYLVLYARKNQTGQNRVGITVSKKLGKAHIRNRIRRRLREIYRLNEDKFLPGWDIVLVGRGKALNADFTAMMNNFLSLAKKAGILVEEEA